MSGDAKYISLYYSLVHQGASDFYKEIIKGPGGNMSYLPPWAPSSGGGPYPPHMLPSHHSPTSNSQHPPTSTAQSSQSSQNSNQPPTSTSVYQNLSPVVKNSTSTAPTTQPSDSTKTSSPGSASSPITSASSAPATGSSGSLGPSSSSPSSSSSVALGDPYQPQGFQRSDSPPIKRPTLADTIKGEGHGLDSPADMILGIPGPSALDFKSRNLPFRLTGKYPPPEQLSGPVMYSYQSRGRPRKNWTTATGLPTMIPITHPPMHGSPDDPDDEEHRPFKCNLCGKAFKLKGGLIQHEKTHSSDRPYVCPECGKLFRHPTHLQQHHRIHTGEKPYECSFCDKTFRQRTSLTQHLRIHTGEKPYACMECGRQFRQKVILDQHFTTHCGSKAYGCPHPDCRKRFREMATLISHMKCHKDVIDPRVVLQQAKRIKEQQESQERNIVQGNQDQNRPSHHPYQPNSEGTSAQKSPGTVPQDSPGDHTIERIPPHSQAQIPPNMGLPTMIPMTHHPLYVGSPDDQDDEEIKPFKCNLCGKAFKIKGGLAQHEKTHSEERPYVCPECGKLFRHPTHLEQHLRIHVGDKPYVCVFCDKTFRQKTTLNQHLRIHTGEKPYSCSECGKQFRQKAILNQHLTTQCKNKAYGCPKPECRKRFREMATLISHMKCHKDVPDAKVVLQQIKQMEKEHDCEEQKVMPQANQEQINSFHPQQQDQQQQHQQQQHQQQQHQPYQLPKHIEEALAQKPTLNIPQHTPGDQLNDRFAPHAQTQMAMANLIPYPHSIFPGASYMVPPPDPRQYNPQAQAGPSHLRPNQ